MSAAYVIEYPPLWLSLAISAGVGLVLYVSGLVLLAVLERFKR